MKKKLSTVMILLCLAGTFSLHGAASWKKHYTKKGITVSSREVHLSDYREFMGSGIINAPLEVIIAVLQDVNAMPDWMPDCRGVKMLRQEDKSSAVTRVIIDFPVPLTDRYMIVHSRGSIDAKRPIVRIRMNSTRENGGKEVKGLVQMESYRGTYQLEYLSRRKTRMTYRVHINPGGSLPAWMVNMSMKKNPYAFIVKLRETAGRKKYMAKMHTPETLDRNFLAKILAAIFRQKVDDEALIQTLVRDREVQRICLSKSMSDEEIEKALLQYAEKNYRQVGKRWLKK